MNYLDLFHGIGGFALGAYWAGMKFDNHYCSDIEPYTQKLYKLRFPDSIQLGDITKIDTSKLPAGDWIISGGFPCQDISIAGKGAGIHGERSGLWFEYWRIIRDLRPRFAIMENVGMLVHRGLREVLGSLAEIGYNAEWQDIRASDMGAPHRRERIWIVAYPELYGCTSGTFGKCAKKPIREKQERTNRTQYTPGANSIPETETDVADAATARLQGQEPARGRPGKPGLPAECGDEFSDAIGTDGETFRTDRMGEEKQASAFACGGWWSVEPSVGRLANGVPGRVDRLKGLGNAIVPQIAELLFRQIKDIL
jgi:DNA (cytosine-5)-methyltransferase 1